MSARSIEIVDRDALAGRVAARISADLSVALDARGRATLALSGGSTPRPMYEALAATDVEWDLVDVFQVDERVAPDADPARNIDPIRRALVSDGRLADHRLHAMDVTSPDLDIESDRYAALLASAAGPEVPPRIDVVHLGIGPDGHTASLVPDDPVLGVTDRWVAPTGEYQGHRRLTLTAPVLSAARSVVWMVAGGDKADAVSRLLAEDPTIPASMVRSGSAALYVTPDAAP